MMINSQLHANDSKYTNQSPGLSNSLVNTGMINMADNTDQRRQEEELDFLSEKKDALTENSIMKHVEECKVDNKQRLKEVRNLEELIKFRIKTVSDNLIEEGNQVAQNDNSLFELRKVVDPLLTSAIHPALSSKKLKINIKQLAEKVDFDANVSVIKEDMVQETTKTEKVDPMDDSGPIVMVHKSVNQQIDEILQLDERDPIRKLQQYFKDSVYGHEYSEDGTRLPRRYKAPKHSNFVMQRYENVKQRGGQRVQLRNDTRAQSQQQIQQLHKVSINQLSQEFQLNNSFENYYGDSQIVDQENSKRNSLEMPMRAKSEQKLLQTNFLSQLKSLQELLKESMLDTDTVKKDDSEQDPYNGGDKQASVTLPKMVRGISTDSNKQSIQRRRSTIMNLNMLDQISATKHDAQNIVDRYLPTNAKIQEEVRQSAEMSQSQDEDDTDYEEAGTKEKPTTGGWRSLDHQLNKSPDKKSMVAQEAIDTELLKGVDSDDEVIEELVKNAEALQRLQKDVQDKRNESDEVEQLMQFQRLRQKMANGLRRLVDPSQLTNDQHRLIEQVTGKSISTMSQISAVRRKDYIKYTNEQLRVFKLLNSQNESQKRITRVKERRKNYEGSREKAAVYQNQRFDHSAGSGPSYGSKINKMRHYHQPFSKKKFIEDIQKPAFDGKNQKAADKLPKIHYGSSTKQSLPEYIPSMKPRERSQQAIRRVGLQGILSKEQNPNLNDFSSQSIMLQQNSYNHQTLNQRRNIDKIYYASAHSIGIQSKGQGNKRRVPIVVHENDQQDAYSSQMTQSALLEEQSEAMLQNINMYISGSSPFQKQQNSLSSKLQHDPLKAVGDGVSSQTLSIYDQRSRSVMQNQTDIDGKAEENHSTLDGINKDLRIVKNSTRDKLVNQECLKEVHSEKILETAMSSDYPMINTAVLPKAVFDADNSPRLKDLQIGKEVMQSLLSTKSRQKIKLSNNGQPLNDEVRESTQSGNHNAPNDPVYNSCDVVDVVHNRLLRNKSSLMNEQYATSQLTKMQSMEGPGIIRVIGSRGSGKRGDNSVPISRKQSFVYHDSIGTAAGGDVNELSRDEPNHGEMVIEDEPISPMAQVIQLPGVPFIKTHEILDAALNQPKESKLTSNQTHSSYDIKDSKESLTLVLQKTMIDQKTTTLTQDGSRVRTVTESVATKKTPIALQETEVPHKVKIRHAACPAVSVETTEEDIAIITGAGDNSFRQQMETMEAIRISTLMNNTKGDLANMTQTLPRMSQNVKSKGILMGPSTGYESESQAIDPNSLSFKNDVADSIVYNQLRTKGWQAKRFKRFPRFSIYLQRDKTNSHLERNYISLNNRMLSYLAAEQEPQGSDQQLDTTSKQREEDEHESDSAILMIQEIEQQDISPTYDEVRVEQNTHEGDAIEDGTHSVDTKRKNAFSGPVSPQVSSKLVDTIAVEKEILETPQSKLLESLIGIGAQEINFSSAIKQSKGDKQVGGDTKKAIKGYVSIAAFNKPTSNEVFVPQTTVIDPFDKVLLLKNIDNAILTSFRTLNKQNNVISSTLKVIHNKFTPKQLSRHVKNTFKKVAQALYSVSEVESADDFSESDVMSQVSPIGNSAQNIAQKSAPKIPMSKNNIRRIAQQQIYEELAPHGQIPTANLDKHLEYLQETVKKEESLLSSMEMSPSVGDGKIYQTQTQYSRDERNPLSIPNSFRASLDNTNAAYRQSIVTNDGAIHEIIVVKPSIDAKQDITSRDEARPSSPATIGTLPINEMMSAQAVQSRGVPGIVDQSIPFATYEEDVINSQNRLKSGEQTFTSKPRMTAEFGSVLIKDDDEVRSSSGVPMEGDKSRDLSREQSLEEQAMLASKFKATAPNNNTASMSKLSTVRGIAAEEKTLQLLNIERYNSGHVQKPMSTKRQQLAETLMNGENNDVHNQSALTSVVGNGKITIPNNPGKIEISQREIHMKVVPDLKYSQNHSLPHIPGHKPSNRADSNKTQIKIQEANVDDYLGYHTAVDASTSQLHSSAKAGANNFKTSKLIQQKNSHGPHGQVHQQHQSASQQQLRSRAQKDFEQFSSGGVITSHHALQNNQRQNVTTQMSGGSSSTYVFNESLYPKMQSQQKPGKAPEYTEYSQQLNAIIDQAQTFHGKNHSHKKSAFNAHKPSDKASSSNLMIHVTREDSKSLAQSLSFVDQDASQETIKAKQFKLETQGIEEEQTPDAASQGISKELGQLNHYARDNVFKKNLYTDEYESKQATAKLWVPMSTDPDYSQRVTPHNDVASTIRQRVDTANIGSYSKHDLDIYQLQDSSQARMNGPNSIPQRHETPKLKAKSINYEQMLVRKSPSNVSNIDSFMHLGGKMQHSGPTKDGAPISPDLQTVNINSVHMSATVEKEKISIETAPLEGAKPIVQKVSNFRQTALIRKGKVIQQRQMQQDVESTSSKPSILKSHVLIKESQQTTNAMEQESTMSREEQSIEQLYQVAENKRRNNNDHLSERQQIAQRVVMPKAVHKVRQLIDNLYEQGKNFAYLNPNFRDDCIGTKNSIFDLSSSHLVDRPGILYGQARQAEKSILGEDSAAEFNGNSFLAGQKAVISQKVPRQLPLESRIIIEKKRASRIQSKEI